MQTEVLSGITKTKVNDALSLPLEDTTRSVLEPGLTPSNVVSSPGGPAMNRVRENYQEVADCMHACFCVVPASNSFVPCSQDIILVMHGLGRAT